MFGLLNFTARSSGVYLTEVLDCTAVAGRGVTAEAYHDSARHLHLRCRRALGILTLATGLALLGRQATFVIRDTLQDIIDIGL